MSYSKNKLTFITTLLITCFLVTFSYAQERVARLGKVVDASGAGIPNVTIVVENTATGTLTDQEGNFEIRTLDNEVLVFRKIGFAVTKVNVNKQLNLGNITLPVNVVQGEITGIVEIGRASCRERV